MAPCRLLGALSIILATRAALAAPVQVLGQGPDSASTYASAGLRALVARASRRNRTVPRDLRGYRVTSESELSLMLHRADGTEGATQIEQVESTEEWASNGAFRQHVIGYRSRLAGPNISALGLLKQAWVVPVLYGNRLGLFLGADTTRRARRAIAHDTAVRVVHPFAVDRDSVYRFTGGDTSLTLHILGRMIPVAVVHVYPRAHLRKRTVVFRGDVYVDLEHAEIVRMRGAFETVGGHTPLSTDLQRLAYQGAAFIDLTNREVAGRYWLPDVQRIEGELSSPLFGETRSVFRVVTHFGAYALETSESPARTDSVVAEDSIEGTDTLRVLPHKLTIAPADSLATFSNWQLPMGLATRSVRDSDFIDVAPDRWRESGAPRVQFATPTIADLVHFDRVEGLFTGLGGSLRFRDAAPGLITNAHAGWAWNEGTVRGGLNTEWHHGPWLTGMQVSRTLQTTNDFTTIFTSSPFLEALIVQDDFDYVDRRSASAYVVHEWAASSGTRWVVGAEGGVGNDRGARTRLRSGLFPPRVLMSDSLFRPNRNVLPGDYVRGSLTLALNPGLDAGFVGEGLGARLHLEAATGQIAWQRVEARLVAHRSWGPFSGLARVDAGLVLGDVIPPQQMFEMGLTEGMLAYDYKEFGGNEAAIWQAELWYALPVWQAPLRVGGFYLPSPSPALTFGFQSGWAQANTLAARRALVALGDRVDPATNMVLNDTRGVPIPVSRPTDGVRTSLNLLLRFFGGAVGFGVTRSLDPGAKLQAVVRFGATL